MLLGSDFEEGRKRYAEVAQRLLPLGVRVFSYRKNGGCQLLFNREGKLSRMMGETHHSITEQLDNFAHDQEVMPANVPS